MRVFYIGSIYKRSGIYYVDVAGNGKRIRKKVGKSKKVAKLVLADLEVKIARREFDLDVPDGFIETVFERFVEFSETNHAPGTTKRYNNVTRNFRFFMALKHSGIKKDSDLNLSIIEEFKRFRLKVDPRTLELPDSFPFPVKQNSMAGHPKTINYELKTLRSIFKFGNKHNICRDNPREGISYLKNNDAKEPRFLTEDECKVLLENSSDRDHPIFFTFLNTGLRLGELLNLQWGDINFDREVLVVRKKLDWQPKTGEREVPLNDEMLELLRKLHPSKAAKSHYIFTASDGGRIKRKLRQSLINTARKAGLEDVTKRSTHSGIPLLVTW